MVKNKKQIKIAIVLGTRPEIIKTSPNIGEYESFASASYDEGSSTHDPVVHGVKVVLSTVKHLSMRRPLLFYGVPGFISIMTAFVFGVWTLQIYAATRRIVTNIALIAFGATMIGLMLMTTAMILWGHHKRGPGEDLRDLGCWR